MVGVDDVGDAHGGAVVGDFLASAESNYAEEHDLGELSGIRKWGRCLAVAFSGGDPVEFMGFVFDARKLLSWLVGGILERLGQEAGIGAVGVMHELALGADEDGSAFFFEFFFAKFDGFRWGESAVEPGEPDRRQGTARRELIKDDAGGGIRGTVERTGDSLNSSGITEIEAGHGHVEQVSAHVPNRADAPIDPTAPIEGVIDGVIVDAGTDTKEEIPGESFGDGVVPCHRRGESSIDARGIPLECIDRFDCSLGTWDTLGPEAYGAIGPNLDFTDFPDGAGLYKFDSSFGVVERATLVAHLSDELGLILGLGRKFAALIDGPAKGFLNVDMFVEIHGRESDGSVHVVGSGDNDAVDVLLLFEHLAVVGIALGFGDDIVFQMKDIFEASFGLGGIGRGHGLDGTGGVRMIDVLLEVGSIGIETGKFLVGVAPVDIAKRYDILAGKIDEIAATHSTDADASDVYDVAGRNEAATENVPREDAERSTSNGRLGDKVASRNSILFC